jgi:hypothetical protein
MKSLKAADATNKVDGQALKKKTSTNGKNR